MTTVSEDVRTAASTESPSRTPGVSMRVSVKPAAVREKACALEGGACMTTTWATDSARMEFTVELLPTPVFPAGML